MAGGTTGDDILINGDSTNYGFSGNDYIRSTRTSGTATMYGGRDNDFLRLDLGGTARATAFGDVGDDRIVGAESNDELNGGDGYDYLNGGDGNDTLIGGAEIDGLHGGDGDDVLDGGDGDDIYFEITIDQYLGNLFTFYGGLYGGYGNDVIHGGSGNDTLYGGDGTHEGGDGDDQLFGDDGDDELYGQDGSDVLDGGSGSDWLSGGAGDDRLDGGADADYLNGGTGTDTVVYASAESGVKASLANPTINIGDAAGDTYHSMENLTGSGFDDVLNGNNSTNVINGSGGNDAVKGYGGDDRLFGADGNDTLTGGEGSDYLSGGVGSDTASYSGATARVIVSLANSAINSGEAAGDTFNSIENLIGSTFNDYVFGNSARNSINGGSGNDILKGYAGNDILIGGAGQDIFVFNSVLNATGNVDIISDFKVADDTIWLDDMFFTVLSPGVLATSLFKDNASAPRDADDRIIYNSNTGSLFYDADGLGGTAAVKFASLAPGLALTAADFVVM